MIIRHEPIPSLLPSQPRVAAVLSCRNNLMALSWHMPISREPFRYAIAVREENYTHALLQEQGSFTLNFLPFACYEQIDRCGRVHGDTIDKFDYSGLTSKNSDPQGNAILDGADYAYECTIIDRYANGDHTLFIANVTALYLNECFNAHPTLFLGRGYYATPSAISRVNQG